MPKKPESALESSVGWLIDGWLRLVERIPGAAAAERALLGVLRQRLDGLPGSGPSPVGRNDAPVLPTDAGESPGEILERLLESSSEQTPEESRLSFFVGILRRLTPDEVRILAAMSDGTVFALVHVGYGSRIGELKKRVADNLSPIGRRAGVTALELVPRYLSHLRELDLIETGPEDSALEVEYEMLETDAVVRTTVQKIEAADERPRILRRSVRLSPFGREMWDACQAASR